MSTNVVITPVAAASGTTVAAIVPFVLAAGAVWVVSRALAKHDAEYAELVEKTRDELRRERLSTLQLKTTDLDRLARSAVEAQFRMTPLANGSIRLRAGSQETLWAVRKPDGIHLIGNEQALRRISVAHTVSRSVEHLQRRGYRVSARQQRSGAVQISAAGRGREAIQVSVGGNGEATVDPQNFRGRECERVVRDLAAAIDGTVIKSCPKPEFWNAAPVKVCGVTRG